MAFKATDYLILPSDILTLMRALLRMSLFGWAKLALLAFGYFLATHFGADTIDALFVVFLIAMFAFNLDAKISIGSALVLLLLIVLILLVGPYVEFINETTWPEAIAVWVYYFLAIGVLKQMKDMYSERGRGEVEGEGGEEHSDAFVHGAYNVDKHEEENFLEHVSLADARAHDDARRELTPPAVSEQVEESDTEAPLGLEAFTGEDESLHRNYRVMRVGKRIVVRYR